ncbi:restriction endonuclease subunit S [Vibrio sp. B1-2]|uniref:restriction endonuclease subunit S n=1 Tax=Vibrio sp. B1-2 TaxID=2591465 RepID=UPI001483BD8A|nr:restriction endonuclease subunit S [Vibrio sp. B1-2]NNO00618.1 restriction endonuclease subunit S [Vibrio sp. B1-2]
MKSEVTVESLALYINRGITPKYTEVIDDSVIVLNQKCIRDFKVSLEPSRRNDLSKRKITEGKMLKKHDVLINSTGVGTLGRVAQYFGADDVATVDSHVTIVRPNPELVDPIYFGYLMKSKQSLIESFAEGTTGQTELNRNSVKELLLEIVNDIPTQKIIGGILLEIDQKLELNTQTNQTLEQIAQALFKSWFVDFDPVKAKIETLAAGGSAEDAELAAMRVLSAKTVDELNSLKASNPEQFNKLAQTAALFPAAMQDSELGEIPEGWELKRLKDILELAYGKALKKTVRVDGDVPVYGSGGLTGYHNQSLVEGPGIIVGRKGTVGSVYWEPKAFHPIDTVFYVKPRAGYSLKYCHLVLQNLGLKDMNTDAAVPGLNRDNAYRLDVITPTKGVMNLFKEIMQSLQSNVDANNAQSASLESLRDTLLPKLLSGEIDLTSEVVE